MFEGIDFSDFWKDGEWADSYLSDPVTDEMIQSVEEELGYKLPESYIALMRQHNGGCPKKNFVKGSGAIIEGIYGIGREKSNSLCGGTGYSNWIDGWGYPAIGIPICDTFTAGHDMIFLDYSECGRDGEPKVVHIDQESDYDVNKIAENFEEFIGLLQTEEEYEDDYENFKEDIEFANNLELKEVGEQEKKLLYRAIWGEWSWSVILGWEAILLVPFLAIILSGTHNAILLRCASLLIALLGFHTLIVILPISIGCLLKMRKSHKYYLDVVDRTWEKGDKKLYCLSRNPSCQRDNRKGFKEGDEVIVFWGDGGTELITKRDKSSSRTE
jgi:hypothetical protein